ncbi:MAG TPA: two-component regulator propeller domain-containing protein [Bacteroidia bacterium]|nr:two-component regulator propeller domain-containing protein [Bacteroidia bacterium]
MLFLFGYFNAHADSLVYNLRSYNTTSGLSDNQVTCIIKDHFGFIWIGTKDGLNRFDGRNFQIFQYRLNSNSVCGNNITCLEITDDSLLWIGTASNGFCSYDYRTNQFKSYNTQNSKLRVDNINDLVFDRRRNCFWIAMNNGGLQQFALSKMQVNPKVFSENTYFSVAVKDSLSFFAGITESLKMLDKVGKTKYSGDDNGHTFNTIYIDPDSKIWCGAWDNALHLFNLQGKKLNSYVFDGTNKLKNSGEEIISITSDGENIWCGTKSSGLLLFNKKSEKFLKNISFTQIINTRVNDLYCDNRNRIWIATENGLLVYDPQLNLFKSEYLPVPKNVSSCKVNDRIITDNGLDLVIAQCGLFYRYSKNESYKFKDVYYKNEKQELYSIIQNKIGDIFIGSNRTVFKFNTNDLSCQPIELHKKLLNSFFFFSGASPVNSLASIAINNTELLLASYYGNFITAVDLKKHNLYRLLQDSTLSNLHLDNLSRKLFVDSKNNLWICGKSKGISSLDLNTTNPLSNYSSFYEKFVVWKVKPVNWQNTSTSNSIKISNVYDMVESKDGTFWVTTQGAGLVHFDKNNKSNPFEMALSDITSMQGLTQTGDSLLWIVSSSGILQYNTKTNRFKLFDSNNGIQQNITGYFFKKNKFLPDEVSVGFNGGFISFNSGLFSSQQEKPEIQFTKLWVMDNPADTLLFKNIKLKYDQNFFKVYVSSNIFTSNEQITYYYQLSGIDLGWRSNEQNPLITYTNLPPGSYILKVKAVTNDNIESTIKSLAFVITPPFTQTIWFYLIIICCIAIIIYMIHRYRINQLLQLQEMRNNIARDLHDDIGSTLGSIHLYSQIADKKLSQSNTNDTKNILEKIKSSSKEIIEKTSEAVWVVKASNDNIANLTLRIESYAASVLGEAGIDFSLQSNSHQNIKLSMHQRKWLFLIFKEAIHNIIKHSHCTKVDITLNYFNRILEMIIKDNGIGFNSSAGSYCVKNGNGGNGINNMASRAAELNATFNIISAQDTGTKIIISLKH